MAYKRSSFSQRKLSSQLLYPYMMALKISLIYVLGCERRNPKHIHQHRPKFRSGIFEFVKLDRSSQCRACLVNLDKCLLSSFNQIAFLHMFLGSIFMSLIQLLDMYQTQLKSNQFTSKVCFVEGLANYIENMTLTMSPFGNP